MTQERDGEGKGRASGLGEVFAQGRCWRKVGINTRWSRKVCSKDKEALGGSLAEQRYLGKQEEFKRATTRAPAGCDST